MSVTRTWQLSSVAVIAGLLLSTVLLTNPSSKAEAAKPQVSGLTVPVTGTYTDLVGGVGTFTGQFAIDRFASQGGQLVAIGDLTGTLTDSLGNVTGVTANNIAIPVTGTSGSCQILDLTLGPLDLNLLGLMVHLDQVHLTITAQSGPGNLLGNLLCGIAGLLDSGVTTNTLAQLLNQLLALL